MTSSSADLREHEAAKPAKSQTIRMPREQVTGAPVPGYTTKDFWRDFEEGHSEEFARFVELTKRLVRVPKSELNQKPVH